MENEAGFDQGGLELNSYRMSEKSHSDCSSLHDSRRNMPILNETSEKKNPLRAANFNSNQERINPNRESRVVRAAWFTK